MKKSVRLIILVAVFVAVFAGVIVLYNYLKADYDTGRVTEASTTDEVVEMQDDNDATTLPQDEEETVSTSQSQTDGETAPDFTVYDANGKAVSLSDFRGKPVVLNFWASWCYYCTMEMPDFDDACKKESDVQFLMVNVTDGIDETLETAKAFYEQSGYSFPVYYDTDMTATELYGAYSIPRTCFIDRNGKIVDRSIGMLSAEELQQGINLIR